jgi:hypothetical protein
MTATLKAHPEVEHALNGKHNGGIDWTKVKIITPKRAERPNPNIDVEVARHAAHREQAARKQADTAAREVNKAVANSQRGQHYDQSRG